MWLETRCNFSMCTSCRGVRGSSPGKILKTKNAGEAISGHFAKCLKSQIYLNYAYLQLFQRRKSPFTFFRYAEKYIMPMWILRIRSESELLLVTRQNDNHLPGPGPGRLVPSSHQRSELSNTILGTFSRGDKRVWMCIPVPNGLGGKSYTYKYQC